MSAQVQGTLLDVLKKKMRQTKEEMEKYKDECEEYQRRLQVEVMRREEVSESGESRAPFSVFFLSDPRKASSAPFVRDRSFSIPLSVLLSSLSFSPPRSLVIISLGASRDINIDFGNNRHGDTEGHRYNCSRTIREAIIFKAKFSFFLIRKYILAKFIDIYVESHAQSLRIYNDILAPVLRILVRRPRKESEQNAKRRKPASAVGIESIASVRHVVVRQGERGREGREGGKSRAHADSRSGHS